MTNPNVYRTPSSAWQSLGSNNCGNQTIRVASRHTICLFAPEHGINHSCALLFKGYLAFPLLQHQTPFLLNRLAIRLVQFEMFSLTIHTTILDASATRATQKCAGLTTVAAARFGCADPIDDSSYSLG
jgi:hypothetical protein